MEAKESTVLMSPLMRLNTETQQDREREALTPDQAVSGIKKQSKFAPSVTISWVFFDALYTATHV